MLFFHSGSRASEANLHETSGSCKRDAAHPGHADRGVHSGPLTSRVVGAQRK